MSDSYVKIEVDEIPIIDDEKKEKILMKSAKVLPNNTSLANLKAEVVKPKFYEFVTGDKDSVLSCYNEALVTASNNIKNITNKMNNELDGITTKINEMEDELKHTPLSYYELDRILQ